MFWYNIYVLLKPIFPKEEREEKMKEKLIKNRGWYIFIAVVSIVLVSTLDSLISISSMDIFWKPFITVFLNILIFLAGYGILSNLKEVEE
jgi:hypothetical protein